MSKEKYQELANQIKELREQQKQVARELFHEGSKKLFDDHPDLTSFSWRQYTCYFADGDPTYFSVYSDPDCLNINREGSYFDQDEESQDKIAELADAVCDFLYSFSNADMKDMFGDHVEIEVTREGVETSDYSRHD